MQPALDDKEEEGINHEIAQLEKGLLEQVLSRMTLFRLLLSLFFLVISVFGVGISLNSCMSCSLLLAPASIPSHTLALIFQFCPVI